MFENHADINNHVMLYIHTGVRPQNVSSIPSAMTCCDSWLDGFLSPTHSTEIITANGHRMKWRLTAERANIGDNGRDAVFLHNHAILTAFANLEDLLYVFIKKSDDQKQKLCPRDRDTKLRAEAAKNPPISVRRIGRRYRKVPYPVKESEQVILDSHPKLDQHQNLITSRGSSSTSSSKQRHFSTRSFVFTWPFNHL